MDHTRRELLRSILAIGASAGLLPVVACGDDDGSGTDGGRRDSGGPRDGGRPPTDGGSTGTDGGSTGTDGGSTGTDGGSTGTDGGTSGSCDDTDATIGANHGHVLMVPVADVTAGVDQMYDIMGTARHNHSVVITAAQFATLAGGGTVTVTSSTAFDHSHTITVMCV